MSAITAGASLDVNALVKQLMDAERAPYSLRFNRAEAVANSKISAFASLSSAFDGLKRALDTLKSANTFGARQARSSAEEVFTATATSAATLGSYSVEVESLAAAHKLVSSGLAANTGLGAGQLTIEVGGKTLTVDIAAGQDKPANLRDAINAAAKAQGAKLAATLVSADDGQRLVLTATQPGSAFAIKVSNTSSPANAALDALVFDPDGAQALTEQTPASDAKVRVDGILKTASGNTISDFVPGLTLTLKKAEPGAIKTLTVSADNSGARSAMQGLVTAYNAAVNALAGATRYNAETKTPSALTGDAAARSAAGQLRGALGAALAAAAEAGLSARDLGISINVDGILSFDSGRFDATLSANPAGVQSALTGSNALADRLGAVVAAFTGKDGVFTSRSEQLRGDLKRVAEQRAAAERRLTALEDRYRKQFTALDALLAQAQSTSNFLAQQLAGLQSSNR